MAGSGDDVVTAQIAYYDARWAADDDWYECRGRFDHGAKANRRWFAGINEARKELDDLLPVDQALDVACGTGVWTKRLAPAAEHVTAVDGSSNMLGAAKRRLRGYSNISFTKHDVMTFSPDGQFDLVVMTFWLSHIPPCLEGVFWDRALRWLSPVGTVFLVDHLHRGGPSGDDVVRTRTWDNKAYPVVKVPVTAAGLATVLRNHGLEANFRESNGLTMGTARWP